MTADVRSDIPGEEVIHAGGPVAPSSGGSVTCLNGRTGAQIWRTYIDDIGDTCQPQMTDVDNNGDLEIIVPLQQPAGIYILNAEDGSIMYSNDNLGGGRVDSSPVCGDVDHNGYPDIFLGVMGYEEEPNTGKVIRYEWNPSTSSVVERDRVTVWHPCAGGLSLADTDNDGTYELYMNERDAYFGDGSWGRGLTSFWAENLTLRWDLYDWGASSNIPMLGDVDHDGKIDVISTDLSSGICVLNSTDGHPLKNAAGTTLLQTGIAGRHNHYQSSIYDIDHDGNLEIISGDGFEGEFNYVTVFDLYNWQLEASIDTTIVGPTLTRSWKGPTVGEISGDGVMDIIVTTFDPTATDNGQVQVYDSNYNLIYLNTGLRHRAIESVTQDIDRNDGGLNELLILTQGGVIYCFDTPGIASNPRARSEIQFYSESRTGVSEYVPYERPYPDVSSPTPTTGAINVSTGITQLSFRLNHPSGQLMSYTVTTSPNIGSGSGNNVGNGLRTVPVSGLQQGTLYTWHVRVTDTSGRITNWDYFFTTGPYYPNNPPTQSTPYLSGDRDGDDLVTTPQGTSDPDGNPVTNIYNWQKGGVSIACLNAPFNTKTNPQDEYSGLATTRDYAYGASGMVVGASWVPNGKVGGAYSFSGNDFIRFPETGTNNRYDGGGTRNEMTVECWLKANVMTSTERVIWKQNYYETEINDTSSVQPWSYRLDSTNNGGVLQLTWQVAIQPLRADGTYTTYSTGSYAITSGSGNWHHVVGTYKSGEGLRLYVDGAEVKNLLGTSIAGSILDTDGPLEIAFRSGSDYNGLLDEVRLYPTAISQYMVAQRYAETMNGQSSSSTINNLDTAVGDQWRCQVTPNDGLTDGTTMNTVTKTITSGGGTQYRLTTNTNGSGSITKNPDSTLYTSGTVVNVTAIPASGWSFSNWLVNGTNIGATNPYNLTMNNNYLLTAVFTQTPIVQYTLNVYVNGQGTTNATGSTVYNEGTKVTAQATPNTGWYLGNWLLNGTNIGSANPYTLTMNANYNLTAVFTRTPPAQYLLHVQVVGQGSTNATGDTLYGAGTFLSVLATPNSGQTFSYWLLNGTNSGSSNPYNLTMNSNYNLTAVFTGAPSQYQLHVQTSGQGTTNATGDNLYPAGTQVRVLATPSAGWSFSNWVLNNSNVGSANPYTLTMNANYNLTAVFTTQPPVQYTLHVQVAGQGTTNATGDTLYTSGTTVRVLGTPSSGWSFTNWLLNGSNAGTNNPYTVVMNNNYNLTGVFTQSQSQHLFSDGFESGSFSAWSGTTTTTGGTATATTSQEYTGTYGANFAITSGTGTRRAYSYININGQPNLYARAYVYLPSSLSLTNGQSLWLLQFCDSANSPYESYGVRADATGIHWSVQWSNYPYAIGTQLPSGGGWYLIEAYFTHSATGKTIVLNVNGVEVASLSQDTSAAANVGSVRLGVCYYPGSTAVNVGVDDVILDPQAPQPTVKYGLTIATQGSGTTNPTAGTYQYDSGAAVNVTANPLTGWQFSNWLLNGTNWGSTNPCTLTMNANYSLTAVFTQTPLTQYNLHVQVSGSGTTNATGDTQYSAGSTVTAVETPNSGWSFDRWLLNGTNVGSSNQYTVNMNGNWNLTAVFIQNPPTQYQLHVQVSGSGITNATGDAPYNAGTLVNILATANSGSTFNYWLRNGTNVGSTNPYPLTMNANYNITAVFSVVPPVEYQLHVQTSGSGTTNATGDTQYVNGTQVRVLATPNSGWTFSNWLLNGTNVGSTNPYPLTMNANHNLTAVFTETAPTQYTLTVGVNGQGTTNATGTTVYNNGTSLHVLATANTGWSFSNWLLNGTNVGNTNPYLIVMNNNYNLTAVFTITPPIQYTLTVQVSGQGATNATGSTLYNAGTSVAVLASPSSGWTLSQWLLNGSNLGAVNPYTLTINANYNLTAVFTQIPPTQYQLHVQTSGQGTTNATGDNQFAAGTQVSISATPNAGWSLTGWLLNGTNAGTTNPYTLTMNANYNLTAVFTQNPPIQYTLHVQVNGQGTTNATGDTPYTAGATVQILATPDSGWTFSNWVLNGTNIGATNPYGLTMNNNYNLTAVFTQIQSHLFSDGFESGNFNAWTGTTRSPTTGTTTVTSARSYSGTYSAAYSVVAGSGVRRAYSYITLNNLPELYTRAYVYIPSTFTLANGQALWVIQYFNGATPIASYGVRADSTGMHWSVQYGNTPYTLGTDFPTAGGWYLLEAYFTHAASGKTIVLSVNGTEVTNLSQSTTSLPNVNTARVGIGYDAGAAALTINIDDVTIDAGSPQMLTLADSQAISQAQYSNVIVFVDTKANNGNGKGSDKKTLEELA